MPQIDDLKCAATFCHKSDAPSGKLKHECITKARHRNTGFYEYFVDLKKSLDAVDPVVLKPKYLRF